MANFSMTRKEDRKALRVAIEELNREFPNKISIFQKGKTNDSEIEVNIEVGCGLSGRFTIAKKKYGGSQNCVVIPWCIWNSDLEKDVVLASSFPDGEINTYHRRKCTVVLYELENIVAHVRRVLLAEKAGTLFEK